MKGSVGVPHTAAVGRTDGELMPVNLSYVIWPIYALSNGLSLFLKTRSGVLSCRLRAGRSIEPHGFNVENR